MAQRTADPERENLLACYSPTGLALCPRCWSRPSVLGRVARGDDIDVRTEIIGDDKWTVTEMTYPCMNPACATDIVVEAVPGYSIEDSQAIVGGYVLVGDEATRYEAGRTKKGIWFPPKP